MEKEVTVRIKATKEIIEKIKQLEMSTEMLPKIPSSSFWKPIGKTLSEFHPAKIAIRIRTFENGSSKAEQLEVTKTENATYSHTNKIIFEGSEEDCEKELSKLGFEKWVQFNQESIKYTHTNNLIILEEKINNVAETLKFEATSEKIIWDFLKEAGISEQDIISLNTAEILAKKMGLIP